jgi:hypothetical protein
MGALDTVLYTTGFLQEVGLCRDAFTILRLEGSNKAIELRRIPIKNLRVTMEHWSVCIWIVITENPASILEDLGGCQVIGVKAKSKP